MTIGPYDRRVQRSRCQQCARSHLKCSGQTPCTNCNRRNQLCTAPIVRSTLIQIEHGDHTAAKNNCLAQLPCVSRCFGASNQTRLPHLFFSAFLPKNSFSGRPSSTWDLHLQKAFGSSRSLSSAVVALGALHAWRNDQPHEKSSGDLALKSYQESLTFLRKDLMNVSLKENPSMLSTTFLLGLFELVYDPTGEGWIKHTMFGTSKLLELLGPDACRVGEARNFFLEIRVFEVSRAVLFCSPTILTAAPWVTLSNELWTGAEDWHPKEALLDLMIQCSDLCSRTFKFYPSLQTAALFEDEVVVLQNLAQEGFELQSALRNLHRVLTEWQLSSFEDYQMLIAWTYYYAVSIYVSGIYDYHSVWKMQRIATPALSQLEIRQNVNQILKLTTHALQTSPLSSLLFLLPLRIAGARCWTIDQEQRIQALLAQIGTSFAVAQAFISELGSVWANRRSIISRHEMA